MAYILINRTLYHHGIKDQKWGIRNGPPYPLKRDSLGRIIKRPKEEKNIDFNKKNDKVLDIVNKGIATTKLNYGKQLEHLEKNAIETGKSYLYGNLKDAQKLMDKLYGTGESPVEIWNNSNKKERVKNNKPIGVYVDPDTGERFETKNGMIIYSKKRTHLYPRKPDRKGKK